MTRSQTTPTSSQIIAMERMLSERDDEISTLREKLRIAENQLNKNHKQLKIKLQDQYGHHLNGHWFYVIPADIYAEAALKLHMEANYAIA